MKAAPTATKQPGSNPLLSGSRSSGTTPQPTNGVGNITNAPLFVDRASGNLRVQSNSPCINVGNNTYVSGSTDLDGRPRIAGGTVEPAKANRRHHKLAQRLEPDEGNDKKVVDGGWHLHRGFGCYWRHDLLV